MNREKSLRAFVRSNRREIDDHVRGQGVTVRLNDDDREEWVLNDEHLYLWARRSGVREAT